MLRAVAFVTLAAILLCTEALPRAAADHDDICQVARRAAETPTNGVETPVRAAVERFCLTHKSSRECGVGMKFWKDYEARKHKECKDITVKDQECRAALLESKNGGGVGNILFDELKWVLKDPSQRAVRSAPHRRHAKVQARAVAPRTMAMEELPAASENEKLLLRYLCHAVGVVNNINDAGDDDDPDQADSPVVRGVPIKGNELGMPSSDRVEAPTPVQSVSEDKEVLLSKPVAVEAKGAPLPHEGPSEVHGDDPMEHDEDEAISEARAAEVLADAAAEQLAEPKLHAHQERLPHKKKAKGKVRKHHHAKAPSKKHGAHLSLGDQIAEESRALDAARAIEQTAPPLTPQSAPSLQEPSRAEVRSAPPPQGSVKAQGQQPGPGATPPASAARPSANPPGNSQDPAPQAMRRYTAESADISQELATTAAAQKMFDAEFPTPASITPDSLRAALEEATRKKEDYQRKMLLVSGSAMMPGLEQDLATTSALITLIVEHLSSLPAAPVIAPLSNSTDSADMTNLNATAAPLPGTNGIEAPVRMKPAARAHAKPRTVAMPLKPPQAPRDHLRPGTIRPTVSELDERGDPIEDAVSEVDSDNDLYKPVTLVP